MSFIPNENYVDIARGKIPSAQPFGGYGERATSGAASGVVWPDGAFSVPSASGVQMSLVSTSAQDGVGGTGIRSLHLHYLDANLIDRDEVVVLNGTTPVLTAATNIRFIQCMHLETYGSGKAAAGTISATNSAVMYSQIGTGAVRCASSARMVPAGKRCVVQALSGGSISGTAAASTIVRVAATYLDNHDYTTDAIFIPYASAAAQDNSVTLSLEVPLAFYEGVVIAMTFTTDKAATIVGSWFGWLENV